MKKRIVSILLATTLGATALTGCSSTSSEKVAETKQSPAMEQVVAVEKTVIENKTYDAYEHVFYKRYDTRTEKGYSENVYGGQIEIPYGYEILDIENFNEKIGYGSQTRGFDVWFINNKPVEVKAVYNPAIDGYDYSEPGTVIEKDLEESELDDQHTLSKTY